MDLHDALIDAADTTAAVVRTDRCSTLLVCCLRRHGPALSALLRPADVGQLLVPVDVEVGGRRRGGCLLALSDRAVLAWSEPPDPESRTALVAYPDVASARLTGSPGGPTELVVGAQPAWILLVPAAMGADVPALLVDLLRGWWGPGSGARVPPQSGRELLDGCGGAPCVDAGRARPSAHG